MLRMNPGWARVSALALSHILRSFLLELATSGWIYHYNLVSFMEMAAVFTSSSLALGRIIRPNSLLLST